MTTQQQASVHDNDRARIKRAFSALIAAGYAAVTRAGFTKQDGYARAVELFPEREHHVYYIDQGDLPAFDANGNLRAPLHLYWHGDAAVLARALRAEGLTCNEPPPAEAIELAPNPAAVSQSFHDVCEAAGKRYGRATGRPLSRDTIYDDLPGEAALFRAWLSEHEPPLFELTDQDRELCPHDDVYERYVGFGLPDLRDEGS